MEITIPPHVSYLLQCQYRHQATIINNHNMKKIENPNHMLIMADCFLPIMTNNNNIMDFPKVEINDESYAIINGDNNYDMYMSGNKYHPNVCVINCTKIETIDCNNFTNLSKLICISCRNLKKINNNASLVALVMFDCHDLESVIHNNRLSSLYVNNCSSFNDIKSTSSLNFFMLICCDKFINFSDSAKILQMYVYDCRSFIGDNINDSSLLRATILNSDNSRINHHKYIDINFDQLHDHHAMITYIISHVLKMCILVLEKIEHITKTDKTISFSVLNPMISWKHDFIHKICTINMYYNIDVKRDKVIMNTINSYISLLSLDMSDYEEEIYKVNRIMKLVKKIIENETNKSMYNIDMFICGRKII